MALLASFVGIDRHHDFQIRDLTGARRDALALWALFKDTLPDIQANLLIDSDATVDEIRKALDQTLGAATPSDTVIFSFAGHGTRDHRLVAHNTEHDRIADTTIPMAELAARFKQTQAKAVLCILDCCFSGGAPARVLEDSPATRDAGSPLQELAGVGRILLAAANIDEYALEHPKTKHGLLTGALLEILQGEGDTVSLTTAIDSIMQRVRAEAARMGYVQTPVLFGLVEGGLILPSLRPGPEYFKAFPERKGARITGRIEDLAVFGLAQALLDEWSAQYSSGLNDLQLAAVNDHRVLDGESLLVVAPTSSGKTFIGEMAAAKAIIDQRKAVFLFPYKALVNEKFDQFTKSYGEHLGMRVIRCTGDYQDQTSAFFRGKYDLAVLTYEMFLSLALNKPAVLNQIGLVVVDEAQFITDPSRGITVELLLTHLLAAKAKEIEPQLIALSAVIGDLNFFDEWLGCRKLVTTKRPVPLEEGVIDRNGTYQYLAPDSKIGTMQLIPYGSVIQRRHQPNAQDIIVPLARQLLLQNPNERIIIFRNNKGSAEGCAGYLAADLDLPSATEIVDWLPDHDLSTSSHNLRKCLGRGTAFHTANLSREEREVVERAYRAKDGKIRVLAATTTVAAGINTPASTVILAEQEFKGEEGRPFTVAEYKNMAGRAGRLGYNETGRAIIYAEHIPQRDALFRKYVLGQVEPIRSSFDQKHLGTWVLRLLAQVKHVPRHDVVRLLSNTYGGYLANRKNPRWHGDIEAVLTDLLDQMIRLQLVEVEDNTVRLSLLGQACGLSSLRFESAIRLITFLRTGQHQPLSAERLMVLIQALPEMDEVYTPLMKKGSSETAWTGQVAQQFGHEVALALQDRADDTSIYYARCKRSIILWNWINGRPMNGIEDDCTKNPFFKIGHGEVRNFADTTRYHLRSAFQIVTLLLLSNGPIEDSVDALLKRLEVGIPEEFLGLLNLPVTLNRGQYLALGGAGVKSVADLWALPTQTLQALLGTSRAAELHAHKHS
jgi:helicase